MHKSLVIAKREFRSFFDSPVAYIVLSAFLLISGWMLFSTLFLQDRADMRMFFNPSPFSPTMLLVVIAPALTMRLIAEERKSGTIELLTTMPIRDWDVVLGKFFAVMGLVKVGLALTLVFALTIGLLGSLDWGTIISGYVGMGLFSASLLAIGLAASSVTNNQIVAFIIGFVVCAALYFVYWLQFFFPGVAGIIEFVSLSSHMENIARGVIDTRDIVYYLSVIVGALFLAERSLAAQHA